MLYRSHPIAALLLVASITSEEANAADIRARYCHGDKISEVIAIDFTEPNAPLLLGENDATVRLGDDTFSIIRPNQIAQVARGRLLLIENGNVMEGTCREISGAFTKALEVENSIFVDAAPLRNANNELMRRQEVLLSTLKTYRSEQQLVDNMAAELANARDDIDELRRRLVDALATRLTAEQQAERALSEREERAALLAAANRKLERSEADLAENQRRMAVLNEQVSALRSRLSSLQALLDAAEARDAQAQVRIESLGNRLNQALAQVSQEQRARAELEAERAARLEAEARRLEQEKRELETYRSEIFSSLRHILSGQEDVRIEGDRFIFSSELLFAPGSATLSEGGRAQIARVARVLGEISAEIPDELDWIIRVDGHTDDTPLGSGSPFRDNWELSQARALSVVRYLVYDLGFEPFRLAANGFGEHQPIVEGDGPEALARNRRIELKLTER